MTDIYGYDTSSSYINGVNTNNVSSLDNTCDIELDNNTISLNAENVLISGQSLTDNLSQLEQKTLYIQLPVSDSGTIFNNYVYANKFIVPSGTNKQYLMADGTLLEESSNQQSNIYLYSFNQTLMPPPNSGQIRWNATSSATTTEIYINHLTSDNIDIDVWLALINQTSVVYLQDKNDSSNWVRFDVNGLIVTGSGYVTIPVTFQSGLGLGLTRFTAGHAIILSIFTNNLEIDLRLSLLEDKTQHQSATATATLIESDLNINTNTQFNINDTSGMINWLHLDNNGMIISRELNMDGKKIINSTGFVRTGGLDTEFLKADGSSDNNTYLTTTTAGTTYLAKTGGTMAGALDMNNNNITGVASLSLFTMSNNALPYFNGNVLSGANRDFYIQSGGTTNIQAMINQVSPFTGACIRLSSSAWAENVTCSGQNYTIAGAPCTLFNQMTQITGNFQIGSSGPSSTQTRIRLKDLKIIGDLSFAGDATHQQLRTYIDNCDISGTVTFPTSVSNVAGLGIFFTNCSFSGANNPVMTIPNQALYTIYFTNCNFQGQTITNNLAAGNFSRLIFTNCSILPSLSLGNCVLSGLNTTSTVSSLTANSITLGGAASSFVKGNGSLDTNSYLKKSGDTMTGALNMGAQNITNAGSFSGTSITLSSGTNQQFLLGNGTAISNTTYTQITSQTGNWVYNGVNISFQARRIGVANNAIVSIFIGGFSATVASTTSALTSNSVLGATFRPINAIFIPCRIQKTGTAQLGCCIVYASGEIGFSDIAVSANFWTAGQTGCGLAGDFAVSFPTNG